MLVIFDCDGVLRSVSWGALYEAYLEICKFINKNPSDFFQNFEDFRKWLNSDWQENLERMGICRGSDTSEINKLFHRVYDSQIHLFPWVGNVLKTLSAKHQLAVLSGSSANSVSKSLNGNAHFFKMIIGHEHVKNVKPHPEGVHLIAEAFQANPSETIIIGDSDADILAGKNAGIRTAGVTWGITPPEKMKSCNPDFIFENPEELLCI